MLKRVLARGSPTWLVAFLGNPGPKYENTRHNAGFLASEALCAQKNIKINKSKFKALTGSIDLGGQKILLLKPQTYMNLSGESVSAAAKFYRIPPENILVVYDDVNVLPGKLKIKRNGSDGGHNGIKSIIACLGTSDFPRIKIGIGSPPHPDFDRVDWVIGKLTDSELKTIREAAATAADAVEAVVSSGIDRAMNRYNS
jgi:PTH1 family peptidyl-tRNA hydrolase